MPRPGLAIVIPALNEAATIGQVVAQCARRADTIVIVVDDGSTDETADLARLAGAQVLRLPFNLGVGGAVRAGLHLARSVGARMAVVVDADGQHDATQIDTLLAPIDDDRADLVVGSRFARGYDTGLVRRSMMRLLSRVVSRRLGVVVADTTSGFRAFGPAAMETLPDHFPTEYLSDTVETLIIAGRLGLRVAEVDVTMHERQGGQPSQGAVRSAYQVGRMLTILASTMFGTTRTQSTR